MTLIGAFKTLGDAVIFADRQESISDYAKWDVNKIGQFTFQDDLRFVVAGAGESNFIDMIWQQTCEEVRRTALTDPAKINASEIKNTILRTVSRITRKSILTYPRNDRPWVDLIWAIQQISPPASSKDNEPPVFGVDIFRTHGLTVNKIDSKYFTGSPLLLTRYLSNFFLDGIIIATEEAEALAAYLLWEAKEYDPNCGKHSDIFTFKQDGSVRRMSLDSVKYWEDHFFHLKHALKLLPLLSCATNLTDKIYDPRQRMQQFITAFRTLTKEQKKMRIRTKGQGTELARKLTENLRKSAARSKRSAPRKSKDRQ